MTLTEIIKADVAYMKGVSVEVERSFPTVEIKWGRQEYFMQESEAEEFIEQCDKAYEEAQDVTMDEVELHIAKPYVECML